jgi:hypothetical protein
MLAFKDARLKTHVDPVPTRVHFTQALLIHVLSTNGKSHVLDNQQNMGRGVEESCSVDDLDQNPMHSVYVGAITVQTSEPCGCRRGVQFKRHQSSQSEWSSIVHGARTRPQRRRRDFSPKSLQTWSGFP